VKCWRCDSTDRSMNGNPASLASPQTVFSPLPPTL
jgi:hypothetical protein